MWEDGFSTKEALLGEMASRLNQRVMKFSYELWYVDLSDPFVFESIRIVI